MKLDGVEEMSTTSAPTTSEYRKPLTVPVKTACGLLGVGNTRMWELIRDRHVRTIKLGRRRLVVYASLEKLVEARAM